LWQAVQTWEAETPELCAATSSQATRSCARVPQHVSCPLSRWMCLAV
jgi:hypothetical protein